MDLAIETVSLVKSFKRRLGGKFTAVDDLNLKVSSGQVFGFIGPNGAGKTTTIKMMCGLITPTSGRVLINGYDVRRRRGDAMRQIGAVLEGTRNVYWRLSPWQNLMYFGRLKGQRGRRFKDRAGTLLEELDLWGRKDDAVRTFSRGMQQKVAIACALVADPPVVLLDEPTLGLDVEASRLVKGWLHSLAVERGKTVLLTSHQLDMVQELCDRVAIMNRGRLVADQSVGELRKGLKGDTYEVRVRGRLNGSATVLDGLTILEELGSTLLTGTFHDVQGLRDLLGKLDASGSSVMSVNTIEPDLEDAFLQATGG